jgi:hypothetical protein
MAIGFRHAGPEEASGLLPERSILLPRLLNKLNPFIEGPTRLGPLGAGREGPCGLKSAHHKPKPKHEPPQAIHSEQVTGLSKRQARPRAAAQHGGGAVDRRAIKLPCRTSLNVPVYGMPTDTAQGRQPDVVVQFSAFTPNRLGRLHELIRALGRESVHVLALTVLDTTDSAIIRFVVDDPDSTRKVLRREAFAFSEGPLVVVEVTAPEELNRLLAALLEAELNVNYLYSFIPHPHGKSILGLSIEDNEMAEQVLKRHQFPVLRQSDISR